MRGMQQPRRPHQRANLRGAVDVRGQAPMARPEQPQRRNLARVIPAAAVAGESAQYLDASSGRDAPPQPTGSRPATRDLDSQGSPISRTVGKASKVLELLSFNDQFVACSTPLGKIRFDFALHGATRVHTLLPGHGRATVDRAGRSTFAYTRVLTKDRWRSRSAMALSEARRWTSRDATVWRKMCGPPTRSANPARFAAYRTAARTTNTVAGFQ